MKEKVAIVPIESGTLGENDKQKARKMADGKQLLFVSFVEHTQPVFAVASRYPDVELYIPQNIIGQERVDALIALSKRKRIAYKLIFIENAEIIPLVKKSQTERSQQLNMFAS